MKPHENLQRGQSFTHHQSAQPCPDQKMMAEEETRNISTTETIVISAP